MEESPVPYDTVIKIIGPNGNRLPGVKLYFGSRLLGVSDWQGLVYATIKQPKAEKGPASKP